MKKASKGFTLVELLVVIAILGILMVSLMPNILGAVNKAQMSAMAKQGGDIIKEIITKSIESESLWPRITNIGQDPDMISGNTFGTSTEYFKKLYDIDNQNSGDWEPFIDAKLECLWGNGVTPASSGTLQKENIAWTIVADAAEYSGDNIPALITRNADTSLFAVSGQNDMSKNKNKINLEKYSAPFGKKGCIVVMKDGSARSLPSRECRIRDIYKSQPTVNIPDGITLKYLEP